MNVQYVIDRALADAAGRSETATRELAPVGSSSADITKLAAALNFIGANLEASVPTPSEIMAQASGQTERRRRLVVMTALALEGQAAHHLV